MACTLLPSSLAVRRIRWRRIRNAVLYILACTHNGFRFHSRISRSWWRSCWSQMEVDKRKSCNLLVTHLWRFHSTRTHTAHSARPEFRACNLYKFQWHNRRYPNGHCNRRECSSHHKVHWGLGSSPGHSPRTSGRSNQAGRSIAPQPKIGTRQCHLHLHRLGIGKHPPSG